MKALFTGGVLLLTTVAISGARLAAQREAASTPTFNHDVAPIVFDNCANCHRPGQIAPMSLLSYKEVRPWVRAIKAKVVAREMPPWPADPRFGHFRNARGLNQAQIDTVVAWVDRGAPEGDGLPPSPPTFAEGWKHPSGRPPDLIIEMPFEMEIRAQGQLPIFDIYQPLHLEEDKFIEALQMLPSNPAVVHHLNAALKTLQPGTKIGNGPAWPGGPVLTNVLLNSQGISFGAQEGPRVATGVQDTQQLATYVPPVGFAQFRPGVGKRIPKDAILNWGLHYTPTGKPEKDRSRIGFWLQRVPLTTETVMTFVGGRSTGSSYSYIAAGEELVSAARPEIPVIPPHAENWALTGIGAFQDDATIHLVMPHMHLRGKDMTYLLTYPDGREEVIHRTPHYKFAWQMIYEYAEPVKVPAGTTLKVLAHFDNSARNRDNPGPDKEVYWSEQSWDEMFTGFYDVSIDKLEGRLQRSPTASFIRR